VSQLQRLSNSTTGTQLLDVDCTSVNTELLDYSQRCRTDAYAQRNPGGALADYNSKDFTNYIDTVCNDVLKCGANTVDMSQVINIQSNLSMDSQARIDMENDITNALKTTADAEYGVLQFGNKTKNETINELRQVSRSALSVVQEMDLNQNQNQVIKVKGGQASYITQKAVFNQINQALMRNAAYVEQTNKVANDITSSASQVSGFPLAEIFKYLMYIGIVVLAGVIIYKFMTRRRTPTYDQNYQMPPEYSDTSSEYSGGEPLVKAEFMSDFDSDF
jgi:hypothetical protein